MLTDLQRAAAYSAIDNARTLREGIRRKSQKGGKHRNEELKAAREQLRRAMKPVRSEIHKTQYHHPHDPYRSYLLLLSADMQKERRKLWKMMQPPQRSDKAAVDILRDRLT